VVTRRRAEATTLASSIPPPTVKPVRRRAEPAASCCVSGFWGQRAARWPCSVVVNAQLVFEKACLEHGRWPVFRLPFHARDVAFVKFCRLFARSRTWGVGAIGARSRY